jgi:peroxiredoxin Q/BCP
MLKEGDKAPDFSLQDDSGNEIKLRNLKGTKVILYFYPKDDTPGCTTEACNFRDNLPKFKKVNAAIYGVSRDSVESHRKFKTKYSLPFSLLSDPTGSLIETYGAWGEKNMYGEKKMGIIRSTVVINENGTVEKVYRKVKADVHADELLEYLNSAD